MKKNLSMLFLLLLTLNGFSQNSWVQKSDLPAAGRYATSYGVVNDKVYLGMGSNGTVFSDWWEYNPANDTWTQKASFPAGTRYFAVCMSINGKVYVGLGGEDVGVLKKDWWEYDPSNDTWTKKNDFPSKARYGCTTWVIDNKGYLCCGNKGSAYGPFTKELWQYDASTDTWTSKTSIPVSGRYSAMGFDIDGKGYVVGGGIKRQDGGYVFYKDVYAYDPSNDSWTQKADFPERMASGTSFSLNGIGYAGLGQKQGVMNAKLFSYDAGTDSWHSATLFPGGERFVAAGFVINGKAYVGLGSTTTLSAFYNDLWEFTPAQKLEPIASSDQNGYSIIFSQGNNQLIPHFPADSNHPSHELTLYEINGSVIQTQHIYDGSPVFINASLPKGIYLAVISSGNSISEFTQKIVLQ